MNSGGRKVENKWERKKVRPFHPSEVLTEEFLAPPGITKNQLALDLGVPASRIDQIAKGKRSISADTAVRLSLYFGNSAEFWLNLQSSYDLNVEKDRLPARVPAVQSVDSTGKVMRQAFQRKNWPRLP